MTLHEVLTEELLPGMEIFTLFEEEPEEKMVNKSSHTNYTSLPAFNVASEVMKARFEEYGMIPLCKKCPHDCKIPNALGLYYFKCGIRGD